MPITAEQITALRQRHTTATRKHAEAQGRLQAAIAQRDALEARMQSEYGCADLEALEAKIMTDEQALAVLYEQADAALAAAERLVQP